MGLPWREFPKEEVNSARDMKLITYRKINQIHKYVKDDLSQFTHY